MLVKYTHMNLDTTKKTSPDVNDSEITDIITYSSDSTDEKGAQFKENILFCKDRTNQWHIVAASPTGETLDDQARSRKVCNLTIGRVAGEFSADHGELRVERGGIQFKQRREIPTLDSRGRLTETPREYDEPDYGHTLDLAHHTYAQKISAGEVREMLGDMMARNPTITHAESKGMELRGGSISSVNPKDAAVIDKLVR